MAGSVVGDLQEEATATADNLDTTAEGVRRFEAPLNACIEHLQNAMGDTHQDDVRQQQDVVTDAVAALTECADSIESAARQVREIEART